MGEEQTGTLVICCAAGVDRLVEAITEIEYQVANKFYPQVNVL